MDEIIEVYLRLSEDYRELVASVEHELWQKHRYWLLMQRSRADLLELQCRI